jgi:2,3-bisphosphoglycerate-independent phosphoglycerate mutase
MAATIESLESLDSLLGEIVATVLEKDWALFFISDHGNAELIIDPKTGNIDKEHNGNPVPFIVVEKGREGHSQVANLEQLTQTMPSGILADVAPTILKIMGLPKPEEMEGVALV